MKKLNYLIVLITIWFRATDALAQPTYQVTSCGTAMVSGLDDLAKNISSYSCHPSILQQRITLPANCSLFGCNSTKPRKVFPFKDISNPSCDSWIMVWGLYTTITAAWNYWGLCVPTAAPTGEYSTFPGDVSIGETNCSPNDVDFMAINRIVGGGLQKELINNIIEISNPRMVTPSDAFWPFVNLGALNNMYSAEGILVDYKLIGNIIRTGMLYHNSQNGYLKWKEICPEYLISPSTGCLSQLNMSIGCPNLSTSYLWNFGDGTTSTGVSQNHTYNTPGNYLVTCSFSTPVPTTFSSFIQINPCPVTSCQSCIGSFAPDPGDYVVSLWVKEDNTNASPVPVSSYANTGVQITFSPPLGGPAIPTVYTAFGNSDSPIIDGWQRVETTINIPSTAAQIHIELLNNNSSGIDSYFDDIRIHPLNSNMKSYVYDPVTLRLSAELDENNYGTFYEYDEEGKLIRVKKETEKGIMTIKETRSANKKR